MGNYIDPIVQFDLRPDPISHDQGPAIPSLFKRTQQVEQAAREGIRAHQAQGIKVGETSESLRDRARILEGLNAQCRGVLDEEPESVFDQLTVFWWSLLAFFGIQSSNSTLEESQRLLLTLLRALKKQISEARSREEAAALREESEAYRQFAETELFNSGSYSFAGNDAVANDLLASNSGGSFASDVQLAYYALREDIGRAGDLGAVGIMKRGKKGKPKINRTQVPAVREVGFNAAKRKRLIFNFLRRELGLDRDGQRFMLALCNQLVHIGINQKIRRPLFTRQEEAHPDRAYRFFTKVIENPHYLWTREGPNCWSVQSRMKIAVVDASDPTVDSIEITPPVEIKCITALTKDPRTGEYSVKVEYGRYHPGDDPPEVERFFAEKAEEELTPPEPPAA